MLPQATSNLRRARALVAAAVIAALVAPGAARAAQRTFSAGSLVIPASIDYQSDDGVLGTYAMVYIALHLNKQRELDGKKRITFYWSVQPSKLSQYRCDTETEALPKYSPTYNDNDGCDFAVQNAAGQPVSRLAPDGTLEEPFNINKVAYRATVGPERATGNRPINGTTKVVKYLGGVWIVDAVDRQEFLKMLAEEPMLRRFHALGAGEPNYVNIHSANASFRAPVVSQITEKPKRIAATGANEFAFLVGVLQNSGLCTPDTITDCVGTFDGNGFTSGTVVDFYADPAELLGDKAPGCRAGHNARINCVVNGAMYGLFWASDTTLAPIFDSEQVVNLSKFLEVRGNGAYFQYDAVNQVENSDAKYQTTGGIGDYKPNVDSAEDCNDQTLPSGAKFKSNGGQCLILGAANQPWAQTGNFVFDGGQGSFKSFSLNGGSSFKTGVQQITRVKNASGTLGPSVATALYKDNDPEKGLILYLAGHKFDNNRLWGERLILNTLFTALGDTGLELARSEPVGYKNPRATNDTPKVYQGTYVQRPLPDSNDVITYTAGATQMWKFPFTTGHLYQHDVPDIGTTAQTFSTNKNWDAGETAGSWPWLGLTPEPRLRDIYTYVGGSGNLGWTRIPFHHRETGTACTDTDANTKCDLSELLALGNSAGVTTDALKARTDGDRTQAEMLGLLVSQVRGHCSAHTPVITGTPILEPTDAQCDRTSQKNVAKLGGIDHSTPAVVGPSRYITSSTFVDRPVVVYAGARDGMLHAFFVSGSANWTADGKSFRSAPVAGEELWAILPPGQIPRLAYNDAMVDGTINVVDVFGNFPYDKNGDGVIDWRPKTVAADDERPNGVRRWRTVLISSSAAAPSDAYSFRGGSELFALDVTNPLHPILLWHVDGPTESDGRFDLDGDGVFEAGEGFDPDAPDDPRTYALKWSDGPGVDYNTTDPDVIADMKLGRYDYRNLGLAYSTAVAKVWDGSGYQYTLFVATNAADFYDDGDDDTPYSPTGFRGAEVFAIDVITGQKRWQWEHLYNPAVGPGVDNSVPPRMALGDIDATGSTERIYLGDMEGHLWELFGRDGRNVNFLKASDSAYHSFPLFGTKLMTGNDASPPASDTTKALYRVGSRLSQQPLTTPIGQGRFTAVPTGKEPYLVGRLALVVGTMGVDWAIAPFEKGNLHVVPIYPDMGTRIAEPNLLDPRDPRLYGVLLEDAAWNIELLVGERVYGMPRVVNNRIVFNTAFGSFGGDLSDSVLDPGNLRIVGATTATTSRTANDAKSFGGVLIVGDQVIVTTDKSMKRLDGTGVTDGGVGVKTFNRATPAIMKSWEEGSP